MRSQPDSSSSYRHCAVSVHKTLELHRMHISGQIAAAAPYVFEFPAVLGQQCSHDASQPWSACSFSGGSYQQHLGMLEQWIDSNGHAAGSKKVGRQKGAKTAGV